MAALAKGRCPTCAINLVGASVVLFLILGSQAVGIRALVDLFRDCFMPGWLDKGGTFRIEKHKASCKSQWGFRVTWFSSSACLVVVQA